MDTFLTDLRFGLRLMGRHRGVTALAVLALALGIGASTAIFSVVDSVLLRPLPFPEEDRLVQIWGSSPDRDIPFHTVTYADFADWRRQSNSFDSMAACGSATANLIAVNEPERTSLSRVNASYFALFGSRFAVGRGFLQEEDRPGAPAVVVLAEGLWRRRFAGDHDVIGKTLNLDGAHHTVVGVLSDRFQLPGRNSDLFVPLALPEGRDPGSRSVTVVGFGRLKAGIDKEKAQAELSSIGLRLAEQSPNSIGKNPRIWRLREFAVRNLRLSLLILMGAVGLVLLIACANVANLLLAQGSGREREMAVRSSMGASRLRLLRQMLTESCLLGLGGGAIGVLLAWWGVKALVGLVPQRYPLVGEASINGTVLAFTFTASVVTGILFGLTPAILTTRARDLSCGLREGGRGESAGPANKRALSALVVVEVALALVILVGAGLMIRSFLKLQSVDPGFNPRGLLTASVSLPRQRYGEPAHRAAFFRALLENLRGTPGVRSAGIVSALPLTQFNTGMGIIIEGRPVPRPGEAPIVWFRTSDPGYFEAMEIPMLRGRAFTERDNSDAPPVAIVNATLARRFWPGEDAVGKRLATGVPPDGRPIQWITVVGIVGDLHHMSLDQPADAELFWPYLQPTPATMNVVVRTDSAPDRFAPVLRKLAVSIDPEQPVSQVQTMEEILAGSLAPRRVSAVLLGTFAAVALALAAVGIYGVVSISVGSRTREIGMRMALGARPGDMLRLVVGRVLGLAAVGVVAGLCGAWPVTRVIASLLYDVGTADPLVIGGVAVLMTLVAGFAGFFPARRASRVDPMVALRYE